MFVLGDGLNVVVLQVFSRIFVLHCLQEVFVQLFWGVLATFKLNSNAEVLFSLILIGLLHISPAILNVFGLQVLAGFYLQDPRELTVQLLADAHA